MDVHVLRVTLHGAVSARHLALRIRRRSRGAWRARACSTRPEWMYIPACEGAWRPKLRFLLRNVGVCSANWRGKGSRRNCLGMPRGSARRPRVPCPRRRPRVRCEGALGDPAQGSVAHEMAVAPPATRAPMTQQRMSMSVAAMTRGISPAKGAIYVFLALEPTSNTSSVLPVKLVVLAHTPSATREP
jgi:hypothetical protein